MTAPLREALAIWQTRNLRARGDRAFIAYAVIMVGVVAVAPFVRALWLSATSAEGVALLSAAVQPTYVLSAIAVLWAGALLVGRERGPALFPPFPLQVFATSGLKRSTVFCGPLLRHGIVVIALTTGVATFVSAALLSHGLGDVRSVIAFAAGGASVGVSTTVVWLVGQVLPRVSVPIAYGIAVLVGAVLVGAVPAGAVSAGAGVVGPNAPIPHLVALAAVTTALVVWVPTLLNRLSLATLMAQAASWETATVFAAGLDFASASSMYRGRPRVGRRMRAVRPSRSLAATFVVRDAVGAIRTPGRLLVGIGAVTAAGVLMTLAFAPATPSVLLGVAAGLVLFAGLGPVTDGIRHAAQVAADLPLYGISDEMLMALHTLFPLMVVIAVLTVVVLISSLFIAAPVAASLIGALVLGLLTLATRLSGALKGMLPTSLLTPIPTPAGDLSILLQLAWAFDGLIIVMLAGAAVAAALQVPALLVVVALTIVSIGASRWWARSARSA